MRKILIPAAAMAVFSVAACERTSDGEYEVDRPVVGTERDTVTFPQVETGTITDTVDVPTIRTEEREVERPTIRIDP